MNLLDINELSTDQILNIFHLTDEIKLGMHKNCLTGKAFILFFPELSIRTRITFERGIKELGGECILFPSETLDRREQLSDAVKYIEKTGHRQSLLGMLIIQKYKNYVVTQLFL